MWIINKATKLKEIDNKALTKALDGFQTITHDQNVNIIELQEQVAINTSMYEAKRE